MGKYFGTDGFRSEAGINLTADHAYKVGRFLGWYYGELKRQNNDSSPARIVIGKDTRRSSYMFNTPLWVVWWPPVRMRTYFTSPPLLPWPILHAWTSLTAVS